MTDNQTSIKLKSNLFQTLSSLYTGLHYLCDQQQCYILALFVLFTQVFFWHCLSRSRQVKHNTHGRKATPVDFTLQILSLFTLWHIVSFNSYKTLWDHKTALQQFIVNKHEIYCRCLIQKTCRGLQKPHRFCHMFIKSGEFMNLWQIAWNQTELNLVKYVYSKVWTQFEWNLQHQMCIKPALIKICWILC